MSETDPAVEFDFDADTGVLVPAGTSATEEPEDADAGLFFGSADEFVRKRLRYMYRRGTAGLGRGQFHWLAAWWKSEEAMSRVDALWRSWEKARLDPGTGMSEWWLNHCDRHMSVLLSAEGPFGLSTDTSKPGEPLPYTAPPDRYFAKDKQPPEEP